MNELQREALLHFLDWHDRLGVLVFAFLLGIVIGVFGGVLT